MKQRMTSERDRSTERSKKKILMYKLETDL